MNPLRAFACLLFAPFALAHSHWLNLLPPSPLSCLADCNFSLDKRLPRDDDGGVADDKNQPIRSTGGEGASSRGKLEVSAKIFWHKLWVQPTERERARERVHTTSKGKIFPLNKAFRFRLRCASAHPALPALSPSPSASSLAGRFLPPRRQHLFHFHFTSAYLLCIAVSAVRGLWSLRGGGVFAVAVA